MPISRPSVTAITNPNFGTLIPASLPNAYDADTNTYADLNWNSHGSSSVSLNPTGVTFSGFTPDIPFATFSDRLLYMLVEVNGAFIATGNWSFYCFADLPWAGTPTLLNAPFLTNSCNSPLMTVSVTVPSSFPSLSTLTVPIMIKAIKNSGTLGSVNVDFLIREVYVTAPEKGGGNDVWENF